MIVTLEGETGTPFDKSAMTCIACFVILIEFLFSLMIETQLCYFLPEKGFLSSKDSSLQIITLVQKFLLQILYMIYHSYSETGAWIISVFSLVLSSVRVYCYYRVLPLYHFEALLLQGYLILPMICLDLANFVNNILNAANTEGQGKSFVIIAWIILSVLVGMMSKGALNSIMMKILSKKYSRKGRPEILIHKMVETKSLKREELKPATRANKYDFTHLLSTNQDVKFAEMFGGESIGTEKITEEIEKKVYLEYFKELAQRFPRNELVKLYLAKTYFKSAEPPYTTIIKIISELTKNKWSEYYLTASLLLYKVEKSILSRQSEEENDQHLELFAYVKNKLLVEKLKKEILRQIDLYAKVYDNILSSDISDLGDIYNSAQSIGKSKRSMKITAEKLFRSLPDYYVSPFLMYAQYHLVLNYSLSEFDKYMNGFAQRYYKNDRYFKDSKLIQENLYQDNNVFLLLSSQKNESGKILFCTKSFQALCGNSNNRHIGNKISNFFPSTIRNYYDELFKQGFYKITDKTLMNKIQHGYMYHENKYLVEVDFYLKYHPYLHQNLYFSMIVRPKPCTGGSGDEFLLVNEDGNIEGASQEVNRLLKVGGTTQPLINIRVLSEELSKVQNAFMVIQKTVNEESSGYQKATEIYQNFLKNDKIISISPYENSGGHNNDLQKSHLSYQFNCNFEVFSQDDKVFMTCIQLERRTLKAKDYDGEEDQLPEEVYSENIKSEEHDGVNDMASFRKRKLDFQFTLSPTSSISPQTRADMIAGMTMTSDNYRGDTNFMTSQRESLLLLAKPEQPEKTGFVSPVISEMDLTSEGRNNNDGDEPKKKNMINGLQKKKEKIHKYLSSNSSRQSSAEKVASKAYKAAIHTKSYPRSFIVLVLVFYGAIVITLVSQIVMKVVSDQVFSDLETKKDLLNAAEQRSYRAMLTHINAIAGAYEILGSVSKTETVGGLTSVVSYFNQHAPVMKQANDEMMQKAYALDKATQEKLFQANVKMQGTYSYSEDSSSEVLTTFEATTRILNAMETFLGLTGDDLVSETSFDSLYYITRNVLDSYESQSLVLTQILEDSVSNQKQSYENLTTFFLTLTPFLLISVGILLVVIIINQYRIEKEQMLALIKVQTSGMKEVANCIKKFQKNLINEEDWEDSRWFQNLNQDLNIITALQNEQTGSGYSKKHDTRQIKYEKFRRRYYQYIFKVVFSLLPLIAINIWDWISTKGSAKVIYNQIDQLQFVNDISNRATVAYASFSALYTTNNTLPVEGTTALEALGQTNTDTKAILDEIYTGFQNTDGNYNPEIKSILFDNDETCSLFTGDELIDCAYLLSIGQPNGMISALTVLQSFIGDKYQAYITADKSSALSLILVAYVNINTFLANFVVITTETEIIAEIIDNVLEEKTKEISEKRSLVLAVFLVCLIIIGALIWFHILQHIREVYNDFKKVLQIFPPGLVLSSYLLKKFLKKTSNHPGLGR